jgi:hypothetical protein
MRRPSAIKKFGWITRVLALLVALLLAGSFNAHATWNYTYNSVYDVGIWANNGIARFRYWYGVTAWEQYAQWGGWQMLGNYGWSPAARNDATPANFIGDGTYRNMGNGWLFAYGASGDYSAWMRAADGKVRFSYAFSTGQWNDAYTNSWAVLGAAGMNSAFVGDGAYRNIGNGWIFGYYAGGDAGYWKRASDSVMRFAYSFSAGQWNDVYTPTNSWAVVGTSGVGPSFIGNGAYWNVGNGWLFAYASSGDYDGWKLASSGQMRFSYAFGTGQWWDIGSYGSWNTLGDTTMSAAFVGDGAWHTVSSDWAFSYDNVGDTGTWRRQADGSNRFQYVYGPGIWLSWSAYNLGVWNMVGPTPTSPYSSAFIGDDHWHNLGADWSFYYHAANDSAQFDYQGNFQFNYNYGVGLWLHYDRIFSHAFPLVGVGDVAAYMSSLFMGDGNPHDLGNGWSYRFQNGVGQWVSMGLPAAFDYAYNSGQWSYGQNLSAMWLLSSSALYADFMGDGAQHDLNNGWLFAYQEGNGNANFYRNVTGTPLRFSLSGGMGQWSHYDGANSAVMTGFTSNIGLSWMWDGNIHPPISAPYYPFSYDYSNDELLFYVPGTSPISFLKYSYVDHRWHDRRALSTATWCLIPTDGVGTEMQKTYYLSGGVFSVGNGESLSIQSVAGIPQLVVWLNNGDYVFDYADCGTFASGTWFWAPTVGSTTVIATDANPDLYR